MFLPLREAPRQLPLTDLTFCSYQLTLFTPPLLPLRTATRQLPRGGAFSKGTP